MAHTDARTERRMLENRMMYFWRTMAQQEIDLIEEKDGELFSFEFKWNENKKAKQPVSFANNYADVPFQVITPSNYIEWLCEGWR